MEPPTIKLKKSWLKDQNACFEKGTEVDEENPILNARKHQHLHGLKSKNQDIYRGKAQNHNVPGTISLQATSKAQSAAHHMRRNPENTIPQIENKLSGLSTDSVGIENEYLLTEKDNTMKKNHFQDSLRDYPPLGDNSDEDSIDVRDDKYASLDMDEETPRHQVEEREPTRFDAPKPSSYFYSGLCSAPAEKTTENPIVVKGQVVHEQPSVSGASSRVLYSLASSSQGSPTNSNAGTSVSQATTTITDHTLRSLRSNQPSNSFSQRGSRSTKPNKFQDFASTLRGRRFTKRAANQ